MAAASTATRNKGFGNLEGIFVHARDSAAGHQLGIEPGCYRAIKLGKAQQIVS